MKKFFAVITVSFLLFANLASSTYAKTVYNENGPVNITWEEEINDDLFVAADSVNIEGVVNGDVFVGGGDVKVPGYIDGNLHIGGGNISISGHIVGNLYIGGGTMNLMAATIDGSVLVGAGTVNVDKKTSILRSFIVGAGTVNSEGTVGRNVVIGAGTILLNSDIGGEVKLAASDIVIGQDTKIGGDLYYLASDEEGNFTLSEKAEIRGETKKIESGAMSQVERDRQKQYAATGARSAKLGWIVVSFLGSLVLGLILIRVLPTFASDVASQMKKSFLENIGIGLLVLVLAIPVLIVMAATVIGLPLAGISLMLLLITLSLSKLVVGIGLGSYLVDRFSWKNVSMNKSYALGLALVVALCNIPFVGFFFSLIFTLAGVGCLSFYYKSKISPK